MNLLNVEHLSAGYGKHEVLKDITFSLQSSEMTAILGTNGSGKSTLLKSICGILPFNGKCEIATPSGSLSSVNMLSARKLASSCSYIPQRSGISIDISVLDVVLMGFNAKIPLLGSPSALQKQIALEALYDVGLFGYESVNYMHLSEGQKQLCILARSLVSDASVMLMDEPESALDLQHRHFCLNLLQKKCHEEHFSALVTLHDPILALNYCDKILLLKDKTILSILHPATSDEREMESLLSMVYGNVTLKKCEDKTGNSHWVLLKDFEQS